MKKEDHTAKAKREMETVIAAAKDSGVRRMVYTSALFTIGNLPAGTDRLADERDFYQLGDFAESVYFEVKALMEQIALAANNGLEVVVTNPTAVFGPGDIDLTLGNLVILAARGYGVAWLPANANVVDVRDVAQAHIAAARKGRPGERYILGGHNTTAREAFTVVAKAAGKRPPFIKFPLWALKPIVWLGDRIPAIPLPANHLRSISRWQHYNTAKAEQELGLKARPFEETAADSIAWFKQNGQL
jgi:dihydroflavonol-4-reductase